MRGPIVWLLGGILCLAPAAVGADAWDNRDVEAAERYRETERERARRYRESIVHRRHEVAGAPQVERVRPAAPARRSTAWWDGLVRAGVAEEDLRTLSGWIDGLGAWASFWQSQVQPRWRRWRGPSEPEPSPPQAVHVAAREETPPTFFQTLGARLVQVVLAEVRREAQRH